MFYFKSEDKISVVTADGSVCEWTFTNPQFQKICDMAEAENWIEIERFTQTEKKVLKSDKLNLNKEGNLEVTDRKGKFEVDSSDKFVQLCNILKQNGSTDETLKPVIPFLKKVAENFYINATHELYDYCRNMDFSITPNGNILAFKAVNRNMKAKYDNKTEYKLNEYTSTDVFDTNRDEYCSQGLHFCARNYLGGFADTNDIILILEIDPRDIVSIPSDNHFTKGRCKKCKVVKIIGTYSEFVNMKYSIDEFMKEENVQSTVKEVSDVITKTVSNVVDTVKTVVETVKVTKPSVLETVKKVSEIVKEATKKADRLEQPETSTEAKPMTRVEQTYNLYMKYMSSATPATDFNKNEVFEKISKEMGISVSTVGRNIRKYKAKYGNNPNN